jgi:hypothetical protein
MKEQIPGWDVRAFETEIEALHLTITGNVTHISRSGWLTENEQYVVEATVRGRLYKFTIMRDDPLWIIRLLSVYENRAKLASINTFALSNERIEFLFEEALVSLANYNHEEEK